MQHDYFIKFWRRISTENRFDWRRFWKLTKTTSQIRSPDFTVDSSKTPIQPLIVFCKTNTINIFLKVRVRLRMRSDSEADDRTDNRDDAHPHPHPHPQAPICLFIEWKWRTTRVRFVRSTLLSHSLENWSLRLGNQSVIALFHYRTDGRILLCQMKFVDLCLSTKTWVGAKSPQNLKLSTKSSNSSNEIWWVSFQKCFDFSFPGQIFEVLVAKNICTRTFLADESMWKCLIRCFDGASFTAKHRINTNVNGREQNLSSTNREKVLWHIVELTSGKENPSASTRYFAFITRKRHPKRLAT